METREKRYPFRAKAFWAIDQAGKRTQKDDPGGTGHEIVRELRVCPRCKAEHTPAE